MRCGADGRSLNWDLTEKAFGMKIFGVLEVAGRTCSYEQRGTEEARSVSNNHLMGSMSGV